jgi:hypothetical protein
MFAVVMNSVVFFAFILVVQRVAGQFAVTYQSETYRWTKKTKQGRLRG